MWLAGGGVSISPLSALRLLAFERAPVPWVGAGEGGGESICTIQVVTDAVLADHLNWNSIQDPTPCPQPVPRGPASLHPSLRLCPPTPGAMALPQSCRHSHGVWELDSTEQGRELRAGGWPPRGQGPGLGAAEKPS